MSAADKSGNETAATAGLSLFADVPMDRDLVSGSGLGQRASDDRRHAQAGGLGEVQSPPFERDPGAYVIDEQG